MEIGEVIYFPLAFLLEWSGNIGGYKIGIVKYQGGRIDRGSQIDLHILETCNFGNTFIFSRVGILFAAKTKSLLK